MDMLIASRRVAPARASVATASAVRGELLDVDRYPGLAVDWMRLESQCDASPFTSWAWVSTWLAMLPGTCRPLVFRASDETGVFALCLLVKAPERGVGRLFGSHSLLLQETGDAQVDQVTIEYAGLLVRAGAEALGYATLFESIERLGGSWRRLRISATAQADAILSALPAGLDAASVDARPSYFVDLAALRASQRSYHASLGASTRGSLNQTRRGYHAHGELCAQVAGDANTALAWLDELADLHTRYWKTRGKPGSFSSAFFCQFHRALVGAGTGTGFTRLTRVSAGPLIVGYVYNLAWRDRIYYYNSGLNYGALPKHDRPGLAALHATIEQALAEGWDQFDFLAGAQEYKRRLASDARRLHWVDIRRHGARMSGERLTARLMKKNTFGRSLANARATDAGQPDA
ncbi:GNAT family N-acetyltransferase [Lysobacter sp. A421]